MSFLPQPVSTPYRVVWTWLSSALAAGVALCLAYGFAQPVVSSANLRVIFLTALTLFILSRVLMLTARFARVHFRRWWVDYVLLISAFLWWQIDPPQGPVILRLAALYSLGLGAFILVTAALRRITDERRGTPPCRTGLLLLTALGLVVVGGGILALPVCWAGPYPVQAGHPLARYHLWIHVLDCVFTATAALTGTGLSVLDIGSQFSKIGLWTLVILMQIGGMAILVLAGVAGWRLREWAGWSPPEIVPNEKGRLRRLVGLTLVSMLLLEAVGVVVLYGMWDPAVDANFQTLIEQGGSCDSDSEIHARLLASTFHSVGAFCNVGLSLPREGLTAYRGQWAVYGAILPLMILGSLGGPVFYDVLRRLFARRPTGLDTRLTLWGTVILILAGGAALWAIESTRHQQLRYPRENTPGRIHLTTTQQSDTTKATSVYTLPLIASAEANNERMYSMSRTKRLQAALFQSTAARGGGIRTVRLDEHSLSPASRAWLMGLMFIGGGIGGTVGGLRITIFLLLCTALFFRRSDQDTLQPPSMVDQKLQRYQALRIAASITAALMTLIFLTTLALTYREVGSFETCIFEATSACCNNGLSAGLTARLSVQGRVIIMLAMLLGRVVPIGLLLRAMDRRVHTGESSNIADQLFKARPPLRE